jgi:hypothetical protein
VLHENFDRLPNLNAAIIEFHPGLIGDDKTAQLYWLLSEAGLRKVDEMLTPGLRAVPRRDSFRSNRPIWTSSTLRWTCTGVIRRTLSGNRRTDHSPSRHGNRKAARRCHGERSAFWRVE